MNKKYIFWGVIAVALLVVAYFAMRPRPTEAPVSRETDDGGAAGDDAGKTQRIVSGIGTGLTGLASAIAGAA